MVGRGYTRVTMAKKAATTTPIPAIGQSFGRANVQPHAQPCARGENAQLHSLLVMDHVFPADPVRNEPGCQHPDNGQEGRSRNPQPLVAVFPSGGVTLQLVLGPGCPLRLLLKLAF